MAEKDFPAASTPGSYLVEGSVFMSWESDPYTARADEAHLSAEEAEASEDSRIPGADEHARWPSDPQASPPKRP
jgi:hypothetical protein